MAPASRLTEGNPVAQEQLCTLQQCISHQVLLWGKLPLFLLCSLLLLPVHAVPIPRVCVHVSSECLTLGRSRKHTLGYDFSLLQVFPVLYFIYLPPVSALPLLADHWAAIPKPKAAVLAIIQVLFLQKNSRGGMFVWNIQMQSRNGIFKSWVVLIFKFGPN